VTGCDCGKTNWATLPAATQAYASTVACQIMWAATGRRYGLCEITVQPCTRPSEPLYVDYPVETSGLGGDYQVAYIDGGHWYNSTCGGGCSCNARCEVALEGPTSKANITSVTVDGSVVPAAAYEVHNGYLLVRTDGDCWPTCRDYSNPTGAFTVVYKIGEPIPPAVQYATNRYACEIARGCQGADCQLPARIRTLTRQGVELQAVDLTDNSGRLTTGITEVDLVIQAENPRGLQAPPTVLTPDLPAPRRTS
jgi:hypothetical protein